MKYLLAINSALWFAAVCFFVYSTVLGVLTLDWKRVVVGILVVGFFTITEVVFSLLNS